MECDARLENEILLNILAFFLFSQVYYLQIDTNGVRRGTAMKTKKYEDELDTIMQEMAKMREDIAMLAEGVRKHADARTSAVDAGEQGTAAEGREAWADFHQSIEEMRARGEKALKDLTSEVERHPVRSIAIAAGAGFLIAKLFGRGRSR
jgi:ElaB/YqjD/DUF883 family membrane-anchored ribosome-binding protein